MSIEVESFRRLARSSAWRWTAIRYVIRSIHDNGQGRPATRAWIRRPWDIRSELLDGSHSRVRSFRPPGTSSAPLSRHGWSSRDRGRAAPVWIGMVDVDTDGDGLVISIPSRSDVWSDDPMLDDYWDVAVLRPVELADGESEAVGVVVADVTEVEHRGRRAWQAIVTPTEHYEPRCTCCALLPNRMTAACDGLASLASVVYPNEHRVRLDVETGICVLVEHIGGTMNGRGSDIEIERVDPDLPAGFFSEAR